MKALRSGSVLGILNGQGIEEPTYTQVPNELFACLPEPGVFTDPMLRVVLALCRETFGYHRPTCMMSLRQLGKAAGLGHTCVCATVRELEEAGIVVRLRRFPRSEWGLRLVGCTFISVRERSGRQLRLPE